MVCTCSGCVFEAGSEPEGRAPDAGVVEEGFEPSELVFGVPVDAGDPCMANGYVISR